jgi:hypothetical protein
MTIRVDLHVHAKVSKTIPFRIQDFERTVRRAREVGLQGFALTEHFHSIDYWDTMNELVRRYPYSHGRYTVDFGFHVLSSTELTVSDGADIIVIGDLDALASFDKQFHPRLSDGHFPRLSDIYEPAKQAGVILIGAHATREGKRLVDVGDGGMAGLDAIEVNGKDMGQSEGAVQAEIEEIAARLGTPIVGSSDAHLWAQVGVQRTILPLPELTLEGLRGCISEGLTAPEARPGTAHTVRLCQMHKRLVKASIRAREGQHPPLRHTRSNVAARARRALVRS